ncbi:MAG TPA: ferric reductase-like transmembrane domain-containing protein [Dehalococcoidia bacterium]|nr:ferric reductase-like transmembrane domain-containing protein [Dehalococcoidia bacterium]
MTARTWPARLSACVIAVCTALAGALIGAGALILAGRLASSIDLAGVLGSRLPWYTTRAAAITAYLLLSGTTVLGLSISTRALDRLMSRATAFALHEWLSWLALACVALHVGALLVDTFQPFSPGEVLVPFTSSYRQVATGIGVLSLYLLGTITISFYLRAHIGQRAWRTLHYGSFALYLLATSHGIFSGASQDLSWMRWVYSASATVVGLLLSSRILAGRRRHTAKRPARIASAA